MSSKKRIVVLRVAREKSQKYRRVGRNDHWRFRQLLIHDISFIPFFGDLNKMNL
jgi:hypothetical protein